MEAFRGKKAKIVHAYNSYYELDVDNKRWNWSLGMFLEFKVEISAILEKHLKWLHGDKEGERANLRGANLRGANLSDEFEKAVTITHNGTCYEQQYNAVIVLAKTFIKSTED